MPLELIREAYIPHEEAKFVPLSSSLLLKLEIIHCPSTLVFWEVGKEFLIILCWRCLLSDDFSIIFVEIEDDVFMGFLQFESLEVVETLLVNTDTGSLIRMKIGLEISWSARIKVVLPLWMQKEVDGCGWDESRILIQLRCCAVTGTTWMDKRARLFLCSASFVFIASIAHQFELQNPNKSW